MTNSKEVEEMSEGMAWGIFCFKVAKLILLSYLSHVTSDYSTRTFLSFRLDPDQKPLHWSDFAYLCNGVATLAEFTQKVPRNSIKFWALSGLFTKQKVPRL